MSLDTIVGKADGRNVVVNPQSGVIVVRAMPQELRSVETFLKAMQLSVERQVMLEAKIIEVTLEQAVIQAGINWAAFPQRRQRRLAVGVVNPGATVGNDRHARTAPPAIAAQRSIARDAVDSERQRWRPALADRRTSRAGCSGWPCRPAISPRC